MNAVLRFSAGVRGVSLALLLLPAWMAQGQGIIHVTPSQTIGYGPVPLYYDIDVNGDTLADFSLDSDGNGLTTLTPLGSNRLVAYPEPPPDLGSLLYALPQNYSIGSSLDPVLQWYDRNTDQFGNVAVGDMVSIDGNLSTIGFFTGLPSAYAGFDLYYNGESHYGWFQISNPLNIVAGEFVDWAYDSSPNMPIAAGAVPEPSTISPGVLGFVALLFGKRIRR